MSRDVKDSPTKSNIVFRFLCFSSLFFFAATSPPPVVQMDEMRIELNKREQEILAMGAKMKTLEEQHHDYQRHIAVLKESLCAKEEHQNMLQADVRPFSIPISPHPRLHVCVRDPVLRSQSPPRIDWR